MPTTRVAAYCVCFDADDRLLLVRLNDRTTRPGAWTLPGGGVEFGEHPENAAVRELREETGLDGHVVELLGVRSHTRDDQDGGAYHSVQIIYRVAISGGDLSHEPPGNSSDMAAWHPRTTLSRLDVVRVVPEAIALASGESTRHDRGSS